ncbi:DUF418 domain-containing protein [Asticcacaulis benevestitus]|uniref:DUF418 domain-containing protein n=1 Tax=Asticcacaulis benevestitus DSM 16100 = ATCC BAA-896 TaxID=1121022 RepID=V4Q771_9CAUL|nr:DUF418 domain-containing protein [Asticcacaulis benevestitus]ESQ93685.1 hypothetical protein ABENE_05035 [Asticcacaulis benevestitus DSM 16100 = ATCC BAA-896]
MNARIRSLDYLRGLSILGILLVNAITFAQPFDVYVLPRLSPVPLSHDDLIVWWLTETFFKEKFITGFTLLFGISLYLVGRDRDSAQPAYRTALFRRLSWLVVFGLIHGALIWHGDILLSYALTGFVFWRWQDASARKLLIWGGLLFLAGEALLLGPNIWHQLAGDVATETAADFGPLIARMRGGFFDSLAQNAEVWAQGEFAEILGYMPTTLGLMMVGLGLFKAGILSGDASTRTYMILMTVAAICLCLIGWQSYVIMKQAFPFPQIFGLYAVANNLLCVPVALGYASALILLGRMRLGAWLLYPLACAGRMAFTNYLMQSLIMTGLFYGGRGILGFGGWFGEMNHAALVPIVVGIWIGQLVVSTVWMSVFRYGPFEWGWRCLTYGPWMRLAK